MGQKTNNRILWHGNGLNAEGKAVAPVKAAAGGDGTDGLNEGELYICNSDSDPALFILTDAGNVVRIDGNGSDTYTREQINEKLNAKVDVAFFSRLFGLMDEDGGEIQVNDVETLASSIKAKLGFWTEQYISALGLNPDAGSTPGGSTTLAGLTDVSITGTPGDGQVLAFDLASGKWKPADAVAGLDEEELEQYLTTNNYAKKTDITAALAGYATQSWVTQQGYALKTTRVIAGAGLTGGGTLAADRTLALATVGTAGTYTKVTVDAYGRVTGHGSLAAGDIPTLSISKISGLQAELNSKLDANVFEELFEKVYVSGYGYAIRAKLALYSEDWISTRGQNPDAGSTPAGGGVDEDEVLQIVAGAGYATQQWVTNRGYITSAALSGYLTQSTADGRYFRKSIRQIQDTTTNADDLNDCGIYINATGNEGTNDSFPSGFGLLLNFAQSSSKRFQLHATTEMVSYKIRFDNSVTADWIGLLSTRNYTSYTVTKTGIGASGTWGIGISGNAATASRWQTARVLTLTGDVTGSTAWDGSGNASCPVTVLHAAEAAKLQTARTLWGQSFNGTSNVSGDMSNVGNIIPSVDDSYYCGRWDRRWNYLYSMNYNIGAHGSNYLGDGNGDGASFSAYNVKLHLHYGLGITSNVDVCNIVIDGRTGNISTRGYLQIGSARLIYDSTNNALYVQKSDGTQCGFYATGFMSAKGLNPDAGATAGGSGNYVSRDGDTMTGLLTISTSGNQQLYLDGTSQAQVAYRVNGVNRALSGYSNTSGAFLQCGNNWINIPTSGGVYYNNQYEMWHAGNDGSGSGLDADLLDGTHKSGLLTAASSSNATNLSITVGGTTKTIPSVYADYLGGTTKAGLFTGLSYSSNRLSVTIGGTTKSVTIQAGSSGSYLPLSGGTISGNLTVSGKATFNTQSVHNYGILTSNIYTNQSMYIRYGSANTARLYCNWASGMIISVDGANTEFANTYIATGTSTASAYDLGLSNRRWRTVYSVNALNTSSDLRLKSVLGDIPLTVDAVAAAPSFIYRWKTGKDASVHAGSAAQYWQQALPQAVTKGEDGYLAMEYDRIALAAAITTARTVVDHEARIKELEEENMKLKNRLEMMERRVA